MKLLLDVGNTRCKWVLEQGGVFTYHGAFPLDNDMNLVPALTEEFGRAGLSVESCDLVCVSSVRSDESSRVWEKDFYSSSKVPVWFAKVATEFDGFKIAYKTPSNLGVDRWLAMLAANKQVSGASIVIDAGSAITVDYISEHSHHEGGLIVPGLSMMKQALFADTYAVKVSGFALAESWVPGSDTLPCVGSGISAVLKGFFREVQQWRKSVVVLTGGDAGQLSEFIGGEVIAVDHLVLVGLQIAHAGGLRS